MGEHFDPDKHVEIVKESYNMVKLKVSKGDYEEYFGFDRKQYPDGTWEEHVDKNIELFNKTEFETEDAESSTKL
jgi:hypothetical protein